MADTVNQSRDILRLDLTLVIDCKGGADSYINGVGEHISSITEKLTETEKIDVQIAIVGYGDVSPTDGKFVGRVHDFTASQEKLKQWMKACIVDDHGCELKSVTKALGDVPKLSWRDDALKVCIYLSATPAHVISSSENPYKERCQLGTEFVFVSSQFAEKGITLHVVEFEPSVRPSKCLPKAVARVTGGQFVAVTNVKLLPAAIGGIVKEQFSLEKCMQEVDEYVQFEIDTCEEIEEYELCEIVYTKLVSKGTNTIQMKCNNDEISIATSAAVMKAFVSLQRIGDRAVGACGVLECCKAGYLEPYEDDDSEDEVVDHTGSPEGSDGSGVSESSFETVEKEISYTQSCRMVIKSIAKKTIKSCKDELQ